MLPLDLSPPTRPATGWRQARPWLLWVGLPLLLIGGFYAVENWRGERAWQAFVQAAEAKGERLELAAFIPPPIAPEENFAEADIIRPLFVPNSGNAATQPAVERIRGVKLTNAGGVFPPQRGWLAGELASLKLQPTGKYEQPAPSSPEQRISEAQALLQALEPFAAPLAELEAAGAREHTRFPVEYTRGAAASMPYLDVLLRSAQVLSARGSAEVRLGQGEAAARDAQLILRLAEAAGSVPLLLSVYLETALLDLALRVIWEGATQHVWAEPQLASLAESLERLNLIATESAALRGERNLLLIPYLSPERAADWPKLLDASSPQLTFFLGVVPEGWFAQNRTVSCYTVQQLLDALSPERRRVQVAAVEAAEAEVQRRFSKFHPYTMGARFFLPQLYPPVVRAASTQGMVQLAGVALRLEQHRRQHGAYPPTLETLRDVPADPCTGQSPVYAPAGGGFRLYYPGWNGMDDGGKIEWKNYRPDYAAGDCVWPLPQEAASALGAE